MLKCRLFIGKYSAFVSKVFWFFILFIWFYKKILFSIVTHVIKCAQTKMNVPLAPALVETYSRLLVYTEIESLGIKGFITQVMTSVSKSQAWGIFHTLVEMFTFRVHHMQPQYRIQLLTLLHSCAVPQQHQTQLTLCVENAALRLIGLLGAAEMQPW